MQARTAARDAGPSRRKSCRCAWPSALYEKSNAVLLGRGEPIAVVAFDPRVREAFCARSASRQTRPGTQVARGDHHTSSGRFPATGG